MRGKDVAVWKTAHSDRALEKTTGRAVCRPDVLDVSGGRSRGRLSHPRERKRVLSKQNSPVSRQPARAFAMDEKRVSSRRASRLQSWFSDPLYRGTPVVTPQKGQLRFPLLLCHGIIPGLLPSILLCVTTPPTPQQNSCSSQISQRDLLWK